ncbi:MAG: hypothetical protein J6K88_01125 [Oscillospiraceae bacterium]|nr:hypothetical protein [Oscillospiraceae bacterium]
MKKLMFIIIFLLGFTITAFASVESEIEEIKDIYDSSGEITDAVNGGFSEFLNLLKERVLNYKDIFKNAVYLVAVSVFSAFSKGFSSNRIGSSKAVDFAASAAVMSLTLIPGIEAVSAVSNFLKSASSFLTAFAPVYAGISAASGQILEGGSSAYFILTLSSIISALTGAAIIPLLSVYLCLSSVGGVFSGIDISPLCEGIKKVTNIFLGFFSAVFVGFLSLKTSVASASDSLTMRGIKFAAGSFFPVVGSALSEAISTAGGYLGIIKSSFGFFGIAVLVFLFLPVAISLLLWMTSLTISLSAASAVGEEAMVRSLKSLRSAFSLLWSISAVFLLLSIISIGAVIPK